MTTMFHIIFKTHLDVGFTGLARDVERKYIEVHVPGAIALAERLRAEGRSERFVWSLGSWIAHRCLETCRGANLRRVERALAAGDIRWHALPFTTHSELMTPSLFDFGLSISRGLDRRFGKRTIAANLTDVPGHTRGIVPLLAASGVEFLHIGCNPGSTPPDVPELFLWRSPEDGSAVTVMYHRGGYGGLFARPELAHGLYVCFTDDNLGPPPVEDVVRAHEHIRNLFPGARVAGGGLDDFAAGLLVARPSLPVVEAELGDTWIHGAGSAPGKVRRFRELCRLRDEWLEGTLPIKYRKKFFSFSENLLLVAEHTWGLDVKTHLGDDRCFTPAQIKKAMPKPNFKKMRESWDEQEAYIGKAVASLEGTPMRNEALKRLEMLEPSRPDLKGFRRASPGDLALETDCFKVLFSGLHGGIVSLEPKTGGKNLAGRRNALGVAAYQTFGAREIKRYLMQYCFVKTTMPGWFENDFSKPGLNKILAEGRRWEFGMRSAWISEGACASEVSIELSPPVSVGKDLGCPKSVWARWRFPDGREEMELTFSWDEKPATRIPEALWLNFSPASVPPGSWRIEKLGRWISPDDVILNGSRRLHAVQRGVRCEAGGRELMIETLDAPLVAPGTPALYELNNRRPPMNRGVHFNLFNNIWGTNFPQWSAEPAMFRFVLKLG
jgi:hypothetical protein